MDQDADHRLPTDFALPGMDTYGEDSEVLSKYLNRLKDRETEVEVLSMLKSTHGAKDGFPQTYQLSKTRCLRTFEDAQALLCAPVRSLPARDSVLQ